MIERSSEVKGLRGQIRATMALGIASLVGLGLTHLALVDIYHGEPDLSMEWTVLRLSALVFLAFIVLGLITLRQVAQRVQ